MLVGRLYTITIVPDGGKIAGVFGPETKDHTPLPLDGGFPIRKVEVALQIVWSEPALEVTGSLKLIVILSIASEQLPFNFNAVNVKVAVPI